MKQQLDVKILYLSFYNSLVKVYGYNSIIKRKQILAKLGRQFMVPRYLRECALKELEEMNLLKKEDRDNIKLVKCNINLEDSSQFFKALKMF